MVIILKDSFSLGDIDANSFPHVYITRLTVDGPSQSVTVNAEVGTMGENGWAPAPANTSKQLIVSGDELRPFFGATPLTLDNSLWNQIEAIAYATVQQKVPRWAGKLGTGLEGDATAPAPELPKTGEPASTTVSEPVPVPTIPEETTEGPDTLKAEKDYSETTVS